MIPMIPTIERPAGATKTPSCSESASRRQISARRVPLSLALIVMLLLPSLLRSDALVVTMAMNATTIAEFFVEEEGVTVDLEIGVADLMGFADLLPDEIYEVLMRAASGAGGDAAPTGDAGAGGDADARTGQRGAASGLEPFEERWPRFFREDLRIIPDDGEPIAGEVLEVEAGRRIPRDQVTGDSLPVGPEYEGDPVITARLFYPFSRRPQSLTFDAPTGENGAVNANIGFVVYHRGLHANDFRYLATGMTIDLDWDDPWYSTFRTRNLRRQYFAPVNGFLYMEPFEVRKEIVARPLDLQNWVDLGLEPGQQIITVAEQEEIKRRSAEFLATRAPVTIDGEPAVGELDRVHFIFRNLRTSGVIDPPQDLPMVSATLGVIFVYPTDGLPDEVTMEWDLFSERIQVVPTSATDEAGGLPYNVTPDDPVLTWTNFLTNPTLPGLVTVEAPPPPWTRWMGWVALLSGIAFVGIVVRKRQDLLRRDAAVAQKAGVPLIAGLVALALIAGFGAYQSLYAMRFSQQGVETVLDGLLENVYRAFDYRQEEVIYDSLENTVSGDLLTQIYLETRRSLELENQGGARAKVKDVEILEASYEPLSSGTGFTTEARWNVAGSVGHWGHIHQRINQYRAEVTVESIDNAWRITGLEVLEEERIDPNAPPVR